MTSGEIIQQLEKIHNERFLSAFHDDMMITMDAPDLKALGRAVKLLKYLDEHKNEKIAVKKILSDCNIEG